MRHKKYSSRLIVLMILLSLIVIHLTQAQQPIFRIGVLDSERGAIAHGARLAIEEINAAGGVRGADGTVFRLEAVVHAPDNLATAVANINQASVIAVLGPETTQQVMNGMPVLQTLNVPVLTPAIGDTIIASDASGRIFRSRAPEILQGRALANYVVSELNLTNIATVQLDLDSTAGVVGFVTSISGLGISPQAQFLLDSNTTVQQLVDNISRLNIQMVSVYGPPDVASQVYIGLRAAGWEGIFAYNQATHPQFRDAVPHQLLNGIYSTSTWSFASTDATSTRFLTEYARAFGEVPNGVAAASYDAVYLIAGAIGLPGDLQTNLAGLSNIQGIQGILSPASLTRGEMSNNVAILRLGPLGGPEVVARFAGSQRLPEDNPVALVATATPQPTATLEGVYVSVKSAVQNVRTGPSTQYDVLGQLQRGEQARVIGATVDFQWVVIEYRGQNGWLFTDLLDVFGDTSTIPVMSPPPTPTPGPPTATPTTAPQADLVAIAASPASLIVGTPFNVTVTIFNQGNIPAGPFAVATSLLPGDVYTAVNLPGLGAGQQTVVTLTGTLGATGTGPKSVFIIMDLNQQVDEGPNGEANNATFAYSYLADRPILNAGTITINVGGSFNFEGSGTADLLWNGGNSLDGQNGAAMYLIPGVSSLSQVHHDLIDLGLATTPGLNVALLPNSYVGVKTAEGNRAVLHVDAVTVGGAITFTYRVYQP